VPEAPDVSLPRSVGHVHLADVVVVLTIVSHVLIRREVTPLPTARTKQREQGQGQHFQVPGTLKQDGNRGKTVFAP
jgi:hypothetical protein